MVIKIMLVDSGPVVLGNSVCQSDDVSLTMVADDSEVSPPLWSQGGHQARLGGIHSRSLFFAVAWLLYFSVVPGAKGQVYAPWTQYQANAGHSGHVPGTIPTAAPGIRWTVAAADLLEAFFVPGAVTDGQHVYVTAANHGAEGLNYFDVIAMELSSGAPQWTRQLTAYFGSVSAPAVGNSSVYVHQWGHSGISGGNPTQYPYVTGLNASDGSVRFSTSHSGQWSSGSRPTVAGDQVFASGGYHGGLDSYHATTGERQWFSVVNQQDGWIPAVDSQRVYVYMGPASASPGPEIGTLYAFSRANGELDFRIWNPADDLQVYIGTTFLGQQNDAIALTGKGLVSFDLIDQDIRWQLSGSYSGSLAIDNGSVYAGNGVRLDHISESTGNLLTSWLAPAGEVLTGSVILCDNAVIVGTDQRTYAIDRTTLTTLWSLPVTGDLALGSNTLLISSGQALYAYSVPEPSVPLPLLMVATYWFVDRQRARLSSRRTGASRLR